MTVKDAFALDKQNGSSMWEDSIAKKMTLLKKQISPYLMLIVIFMEILVMSLEYLWYTSAWSLTQIDAYETMKIITINMVTNKNRYMSKVC